MKRILLLLLLTMLPCAVRAQDEFDKSPAAKVVKQYLNHIMQREWEKSAELVEPESLKSLVGDYVSRVKKARTMDEERAMCDRVGKTSPEQIAAMKPLDFYVAYHRGIQDKYNITDEMVKAVQSSLKMRLLSVSEEDPQHSHVLVRTKHSNGRFIIENLDLVSVVKVEGAWKIGLNEQTPKVTPDPAAGPKNSGAGDPVKPAAPATPPAKDPKDAKDTKKPATRKK